ncbi:MAG: M3 family metallopeptidase [Bacteroidota bacterium]
MKMKKLIGLLMASVIMFSACGDGKDKQKDKGEKEPNPLLKEWTTSFKVPPFEEIAPKHFMPAFEATMKIHNEEIEAIVKNDEEPTFENTIAAMSLSGQDLSRVSSVFFNLNSANTNDSLQSIAQEASPMLSSHEDEIKMNDKLFAKVKEVYENREEFDLNDEQSYILDNVYKSFVRSGANLSDKDQKELKEINKKLSQKTLQFGQNVLQETNDFKLVIEDKENLAGLKESQIEKAAETAKEADMEGTWVFTTQKPSMIPFLQNSEKRELREKLYKAYLNRGNNDNDADNNELLSDIVKLRVQKAHLLGYDSHAEYRLETRMAKKPENVKELLDNLWEKALPSSKEEAKELQKLIDEEGKDFELKSWDWWYYTEKLRKQKFDMDDSDLRPYFQLENVRKGAFDVANELYGITFEEINGIPVPHPEATAFEVKDKDGSHLGVLYTDFFPRESKRGGAWCSDYREHFINAEEEEVHPVMTVVCNFTEPSGDKPSLLSLDEVETLFHEFGHALDGLFAKNTYRNTFVARDFVELPSQIMEHWATQPTVLKMYAKHYETGEAIPEELIKKIQKSSKFNQGFATTEYLAAAMLDMAYHTITEVKNVDVPRFEKTYLNKIGLIDEIEPRYHSTYFRHITGGYDAGYYSYIWSGVLDSDAFAAFEEAGLFDQETAQKFRENVLEKNGIEDPEKLYRQFRGQDPDEKHLLENRGLK